MARHDIDPVLKQLVRAINEPGQAAVPVTVSVRGTLPALASVMSSNGKSDHTFVVVASRLPVDRVDGPDGRPEWQPSPGGLVTALEPVMRRARGAWIGWSGDAGPAPGAFAAGGLDLVGLGLSEAEVRCFYEGFCNATLWPLYHDVIAPPQFHRRWWEAYVTVNRRFARAAAEQAAPGATVWVHDYQLQLVPRMLREQRDDVRIGFFNHIPFPGMRSSPSCRGGRRAGRRLRCEPARHRGPEGRDRARGGHRPGRGQAPDARDAEAGA